MDPAELKTRYWRPHEASHKPFAWGTLGGRLRQFRARLPWLEPHL